VTKDYEPVFTSLPRLAAKMPITLVFVRGAQSTFLHYHHGSAFSSGVKNMATSLDPRPGILLGLFNRDGLGKIARLIDICAFENGGVIGQKL